MRTLYIVLIVLVVAIFIGVGYAWNKFHAGKESAAEVKTKYNLTTAALVNEFLADSAEAHKKYAKDQTPIELRGQIYEMEKDQFGNLSLIFQEKDVDIQCTIRKENADKVADLNKGDTAKVKGFFIDFQNDDIFGLQIKVDNCILVK